jgi:hypothetical protein
MRKVFILLAALSFVLFTAEKCSLPTRGGSEPEPEVDTLAPTPSAADLIVMVYSNAYDGFLNVREQPDVKSPIIAKIVNGPMGAVKMGEVGGWTIVKVGDKIGYASSRYLQTEPTPEFTDADMAKLLQGVWIRESPQDQRVIVLFKNGILAEGFTFEGWTNAGNWKVEGNVLSVNYTREIDFSNPGTWLDVDIREKWIIVSGDLLEDNLGDPFKKSKLLTDKQVTDIEGHGGSLEWYELSPSTLDAFYEQAHLRATGSFPSGE